MNLLKGLKWLAWHSPLTFNWYPPSCCSLQPGFLPSDIAIPSADAMSPSGLKSGSQFYPSYPNNPRRRPSDGGMGKEFTTLTWLASGLSILNERLLHLLKYFHRSPTTKKDQEATRTAIFREWTFESIHICFHHNSLITTLNLRPELSGTTCGRSCSISQILFN